MKNTMKQTLFLKPLIALVMLFICGGGFDLWARNDYA